jgi:class 3 adenylate cyclase
MSETRKIAAILVSDVVGYSRLAGADEDRTLARLRALRSDLIDPTVAVHHGRVVRRTAEGSRSKSHPMKALVLTALLLPIGAAAVSPEDAYLAARDRYCGSKPWSVPSRRSLPCQRRDDCCRLGFSGLERGRALHLARETRAAGGGGFVAEFFHLVQQLLVLAAVSPSCARQVDEPNV